MLATRGNPSEVWLGVTRRSSLSEPGPHTQTGAPGPASRPNRTRAGQTKTRASGKGSRPDMGSWNVQAASRRVTRTDARVTTYPRQPAGPEDPARSGGPQHTGPHRAGCNQELLHHRAHRSRQVDP